MASAHRSARTGSDRRARAAERFATPYHCPPDRRDFSLEDDVKCIVETERLYLRAFVPEDAEMIYRLNSDPDVMRHMPDHAKANASRESAERMVERSMSSYEAHPGLGIWPTCLREDDACIGWTCLKQLDDTDEIELGYRFFPEHWGKGLATEISREVVRYGFEDLGLQCIVGITHPENAASRRVLEKVGFRYERDAHHYGIDVTYYVLETTASAEGEE